MRFILTLFAFAAMFAELTAQVNFGEAFSIQGDEQVVYRDVVTDHDNNIVTTGFFVGSADFDMQGGVSNLESDGNYSPFVQKLNSEGELDWVAHFNSTSNAFALAVDVDSEGSIYTMGMFLDSIDVDPGMEENWLVGFPNTAIKYVVKLNASGTFEWGFAMALGVNDGGWDIAVDQQDNLYCTGQFNFQTDFDPGPDLFLLPTDQVSSYTHSYLLKLNSDGAFLWAKDIFSPPGGENYGRTISIAPNGDVLLSGEFNGPFSPDPNAMFPIDAGFGFDAYVLRYTQEGAFLNVKVFQGVEPSFHQTFVTDSDIDSEGNLYVTISFEDDMIYNPEGANVSIPLEMNNSRESVLVKLDSNGDLEWTGQVSGLGTERMEGVSVNPLGTIYVTGYFDGELTADGTASISNGTNDVFWLEYQSNGQMGWSGVAGAEEDDRGMAIASDSFGNVYAVGDFSNSADFDPTNGTSELSALSNPNAFLVHLIPFGVSIEGVEDTDSPSLYPNPSNGPVRLKDVFNTDQLTIYDSAGRIPYHASIGSFTSQDLPLKDGIYLVNLSRNGKQIFQERLVIQH